MKRWVKKGLSLLVVMAMLLTMMPLTGLVVMAEDESGFDVPDGYTMKAISTADELKAIQTGSAASKTYYYLEKDITITDATWTPIGTNEYTDAFYDILDGNGFSITYAGTDGTGVTMSTSATWNGGLFLAINGSALVKNLTFRGTISSSRESTGALTGRMLSGTIEHCMNYANITVSNQSVGGLAGRVDVGVVVNCINYGTISGGNFTGGLVGQAQYSTALTTDEMNAGVVKLCIANCANFGNVTGGEKVGGILGLAAQNKTFRIENSYNVGTIKGGSTTYGAIVCSAWPDAVNVTNVYALKGSSGKMLAATKQMTREDMQSRAFVETLNANVVSGISYTKTVDGTPIAVQAAAWKYNENGYPTLDINITPVARPVVKVACVGDSITYGTGASGAGKNYVGQLQTLLGSRYNVQNFGNSGKTLLSGYDVSYDQTTEYQSSIDFAPDVVTIMLGSNDSKSSYWNATNFESELTAMVQIYRDLPSKPLVIIATSPKVYEDGDGNWGITDTVVTNEVAPIQRRVAKAMNCVLVDTNTNTRNWLTESSTYLADGVHPTDAGYSVLANLFAAGITDACSRIHTFSVAGQDAVVDHVKNTITLTKIEDVDWTAQTPTMTVANGALVTPEGEQDFTSTLTYTVDAPDLETMRTYIVVWASESEEEPQEPETETFLMGDLTVTTGMTLVVRENVVINGQQILLYDYTPSGSNKSLIVTIPLVDVVPGLYMVSAQGLNGSRGTYKVAFGNNAGTQYVENKTFDQTVSGGTTFEERSQTDVFCPVAITEDMDTLSITITAASTTMIGFFGFTLTPVSFGADEDGTIVYPFIDLPFQSTSTTANSTSLVGSQTLVYWSPLANNTITVKIPLIDVTPGVYTLSAQYLAHNYRGKYSVTLDENIATEEDQAYVDGLGLTQYTSNGSASADDRTLTDVYGDFTITGEQEYMTLTFKTTDTNAYIAGIGFFNITLTPVPVSVQFVGRFNEPIATKEATTLDGVLDLCDTVEAPALGGYRFAGWSQSLEDIQILFALGLPIEISAIYEVDATNKSYTLSGLVNMIAKDGQGNEVTAETTLSFDHRITVTNATDNTVAYWVLDGAKVGFGANQYVFYISGNNEIAVVFESDAAEDLVPEVVLQQTMTSYANGVYNLSVIAQTTIPNNVEYTDLSYGMYYTALESAIRDLSSGGAYLQVTSSKTEANQQYMTHLLSVAEGKTRFARAYMQYTANGETVTLLSDQYVKFVTTAVGVTVTEHIVTQSAE